MAKQIQQKWIGIHLPIWVCDSIDDDLCAVTTYYCWASRQYARHTFRHNARLVGHVNSMGSWEMLSLTVASSVNILSWVRLLHWVPICRRAHDTPTLLYLFLSWSMCLHAFVTVDLGAFAFGVIAMASGNVMSLSMCAIAVHGWAAKNGVAQETNAHCACEHNSFAILFVSFFHIRFDAVCSSLFFFGRTYIQSQ